MGQIWTIIFVVLVLIGWAIASRMDRADAKRRRTRDAQKGQREDVE
ncbi:MAG: hypothetical protein QOJ64_4116 [Acidobacteriota bacterium]|jgi:TM2 domain-containing membrane protein YozV|nr:hypothetical protein [Acidobacteriota bacterium]